MSAGGNNEESDSLKKAFCKLALSALAALPCSASSAEDVAGNGLLDEVDWIEMSGWAAPEFESAHASMGCVKVIYPVFNVDFGVAAHVRGGEYGRLLLGGWTSTDVSSHYRDVRRYAFQEIDPIVAYAYTWKFRDGWSLDSQWGAQWNIMDGYYGAAHRTYDEWQFWERLKTPWCTLWAGMRNFYLPVTKASVRAGVMRSFEIFDSLSFVPNLWFDGGSERWNTQRFGYGESADSISGGFNSVSLQLHLVYALAPHLRLYGGVTQYCAVDRRVRDNLKANPSRESVTELLIVTMGARLEF